MSVFSLVRTAKVGIAEESLDNKHFVVCCGLPFAADGLVLLTNDGLFAENLARLLRPTLHGNHVCISSYIYIYIYMCEYILDAVQG